MSRLAAWKALDADFVAGSQRHGAWRVPCGEGRGPVYRSRHKVILGSRPVYRSRHQVILGSRPVYRSRHQVILGSRHPTDTTWRKIWLFMALIGEVVQGKNNFSGQYLMLKLKRGRG